MGANEHLLFWLGIEAEGRDEGWALAIKGKRCSGPTLLKAAG